MDGNKLKYQVLYDDIMKDVANIVKKHLDETFGIKEYDNLIFTNELKNISNQLLNKIISNNITYDYALYENDIYLVNLERNRFLLSSIDWCNNVDIYLTETPLTNEDLDIFIIDDNYTYNERNDKLILCHYTFKLLKDNNKIVEPFIVKNNKLVRTSIIISYNKNIKLTVDELTSILKHEFSHIYDLLSNKLTIAELNSDLIDLNSNYGNDLNLSLNSFITLNNLLTENDENRKKELIKNNINYQIIHLLFKDNIYLLNKSELKARLNNCRYDIQTKIKNIDINNLSDILQEELRKISKDFNTYFILFNVFKLLIDYLPDNIKKEFAEKDIKNIYGKLRPEIDNKWIKYPYNNSFKDKNNTYSELSFNAFFNYHKENIYNIFLKHAISIFEDYIGYDDIFDYKNALKGFSHQTL